MYLPCFLLLFPPDLAIDYWCVQNIKPIDYSYISTPFPYYHSNSAYE